MLDAICNTVNSCSDMVMNRLMFLVNFAVARKKKKQHLCLLRNRERYIANFGPTDPWALTGFAAGTTPATLRLLRAWTLAHSAAAAAAVADSGGGPLVYAPGDASVLAVVAERRWAGAWGTHRISWLACLLNQSKKKHQHSSSSSCEESISILINWWSRHTQV